MFNLFLENKTLDIIIAVSVVLVLAIIIFTSYFLPMILKRKNKDKSNCGCKKCGGKK